MLQKRKKPVFRVELTESVFSCVCVCVCVQGQLEKQGTGNGNGKKEQETEQETNQLTTNLYGVHIRATGKAGNGKWDGNGKWEQEWEFAQKEKPRDNRSKIFVHYHLQG